MLGERLDRQAQGRQDIFTQGFAGVRRVAHSYDFCPLSVVVELVDQFDIKACDTEYQAPIAGHAYRPETEPLSFERVQLPARHIHVLGDHGTVEELQLSPQSLDMGSLNAAGITRFVEEPQAFVAKADDHGARIRSMRRNRSVTPCVTPCR
jgi:hypothetical protein